MRKTPKVFLVNPANVEAGYSFITPRWLFVIANATPSDLVGDPIVVDESIKKFNHNLVGPGDIVGVGITTGNCQPGYRVLQQAKSKGATVVMGGIHATIFPEEPLEMGADAVVTGNGDLIWSKVIKDALDRKLLKHYNGGKVPGDQLLPARWDLVDRTKYFFPSVQTVVGCPENCSFCSVWVTEGRNPRQRLTDNVIAEVNTLNRMGFRLIVFADDNFNPATLGRIKRETSPSKRKELELIREQRLAFFDEYSRRVNPPLPAFTQMTSEVVSDPEYLSAMHGKMGIRVALVGVESFTEAGLKTARKQWNPVGQKMVEAIQTMQAKGILVLSSIICGLETDTQETIATMGSFARESGTFLAQFTLYQPFPGTVDFQEMMKDLENREKPKPFPLAPKRGVQILHKKFWCDPKTPRLVIKHPLLDEKTLLHGLEKNWKSFYTIPEIFKRAKNLGWPLSWRIIYGLGSLGFKTLYVGQGVSADSVKTRKMSLSQKLLLKSAMRFMNRAGKSNASALKTAIV